MLDYDNPYTVTTESASSFVNKDGEVVDGINLIVGKAWAQKPNKEESNPLMELDFGYIVATMMKKIPHYKDKKTGELRFREAEVTGKLSIWRPRTKKEES